MTGRPVERERERERSIRMKVSRIVRGRERETVISFVCFIALFLCSSNMLVEEILCLCPFYFPSILSSPNGWRMSNSPHETLISVFASLWFGSTEERKTRGRVAHFLHLNKWCVHSKQMESNKDSFHGEGRKPKFSPPSLFSFHSVKNNIPLSISKFFHPFDCFLLLHLILLFLISLYLPLAYLSPSSEYHSMNVLTLN